MTLPTNARDMSATGGHFAGGFGGSFFGPTDSPLGGGTLPEETKVAQVLPDSGLYWVVFPGIGGIRIKT